MAGFRDRAFAEHVAHAEAEAGMRALSRKELIAFEPAQPCCAQQRGAQQDRRFPPSDSTMADGCFVVLEVVEDACAIGVEELAAIDCGPPSLLSRPRARRGVPPSVRGSIELAK